MRLRVGDPKRSWTNNFFYRRRAASRFHTAKTHKRHSALNWPGALLCTRQWKSECSPCHGRPRILGKIGSLRRLPLTCPQQSATLRLVPAAGLVWSFGGAVTEQRVQRRLAAILAADVVGYSALMQRAEEATYAEFERLKRELIVPSLSRHDGRLIKTTGDGALAEFVSPSAAVRCAMEIQEDIASGRSSLKLRIGVNLGEVIVGADGDLFGDGINIAVRLEGVADPGGILISEKVYSEVEGKLEAGFEDRGEQQLKNIAKPVHAFSVRAGAFSELIDRLSVDQP